MTKPNGRYNGAGRGEAKATFEQLLLIETEDHIIWPFAHNQYGYGVVSVEGCLRLTHNLALECKVGPCPFGKEGCHDPGCPTLCMNYRHLRWGTRAENQADRLLNGTSNRGSANGHSRLTESDVLNIREEYLTSSISQSALAKRYGVTQPTISQIITNGRWNWL